MAAEIFLKILNFAISAGWVVLALLLLRPLLKKLPKRFVPLFWALAGIRLVLPVSLQSIFSILPSAETIPPDILYARNPVIDSGIPAVDQTVNPVITQSFAPMPGASVNPLQIWLEIGVFLWLAGILAMIVYAAVSYFRLSAKIRTAVLLRENIYQSEQIVSPFVFGVFRPRIYLPYHIGESAANHIIAHEQAHIRRGDHLWKPLAFFLLSVYWFHPLLWAAYICFCRDIELACDEHVIRDLEQSERADYSQALLYCSTGRHFRAACPLAFGEIGVKERIKHVLNYRRPAFWLAAAAVCAGIVLGLCLLTDPFTPYDFVKRSGNINTADPNQGIEAVYECGFGHRIKGGKIWAELWQNGECVRSGPVLFTEYAGEITAALNIRKQENVPVGIDAAVSTDQYGGSMTEFYPFAENIKVNGWASACREEDEMLKVRPGEQRILAALAVDIGNGVRGYGCQTLENEPELLTEMDYILVVRASFEDELPLPPYDGQFESEETGQPFKVHARTLEEAIRHAIMENNESSYPEEYDFACCDFEVLKISELTVPENSTKHTVTCYGVELYNQYCFTPGGIEDAGGSHIPVAMTFSYDTSNEEGYELEEYWQPRDGSLYAEDILEKFPPDIAKDALDSQKYIERQIQRCYAKAVAYAELDTDQIIEGYLKTICAEPKEGSDIGSYIEKHSLEYRELLYYGDYTLSYCFRRFEQGGETGLEGKVMSAVCQEILKIQGIDPSGKAAEETGQAWYDARKESER